MTFRQFILTLIAVVAFGYAAHRWIQAQPIQYRFERVELQEMMH